jgi:hypothetical protein
VVTKVIHYVVTSVCCVIGVHHISSVHLFLMIMVLIVFSICLLIMFLVFLIFLMFVSFKHS